MSTYKMNSNMKLKFQLLIPLKCKRNQRETPHQGSNVPQAKPFHTSIYTIEVYKV